MVGAKCEAEIITISANLSKFFFLQVTRMKAFLISHFLIWTSAWNDLQFLRLLVSDRALSL